MLGKVVIVNGQKKIQGLTADTGVGAPVGSYLYLEKKSNPQGYLYCDGSTFDETAYPALYQYLGTNVLPDWREFSAVGAEQNTTNVYDAQTNPNGVIHSHDVFTQGQAKDDSIASHRHDIRDINNNKLITTAYPAESGWPISNATGTASGSVVVGATSDFGGNVTRGKSRAVFIYIKATSGLTENQQENVLNTINENNSYSMEEHPTGAKWIDGKPIYRLVWTASNINIGVNSDFALTNVLASKNMNSLISIKGTVYFPQNAYINMIPNESVGVRFNTSDNYIYIRNNYSSSSNDCEVVIIIEYTKTTD